ncbi:heavy metal translocating P-type ATPase [Natronorubrum sp. JWXQ-INN-674]|uniref:Heavy metal translocating P-type ATPase n=1 Tax=Natronorubrum halalkaliphilum TaxID=2691917 RepID=A0A6B0VSQ6_9EURY|nr:cation-translocating P-type ATPase [Natronorubrum halalkaliphilum]MXV64568.1 heavy metal translocating P-type ATPase [Natronorubrum halalkaliphilum]
MSDWETERGRCRLCGAECGESAAETVEAADSDADADTDVDGFFCSSGCREIVDVLGDSDGTDGTNGTDAADFDADTGRNPDSRTKPASQNESHARTFFRVDGMHSALCESYLESVAENRAGVSDAAASYVTETVRVDHDPDRTSAAALEDGLTTIGYTAYRRENAAEAPARGDTDADAGPAEDQTSTTHRSREMHGLRKRRSEDVLELRYIVGIVFGSFLLIPYVTVFYPVYLAGYTDYWLFGLYAETFASFDGVLFLPLFFVLTGAVLYLTGMPLLRGAYVSLKLREPSVHLLATLTIVAAFAYGTLAFVVGQPEIYYDLTILVAATVMAAVFYEATIKRRAMDRLTDLTVSQVETARVLEADGTTRESPIEEIGADDRLLVRAGERIPVDGTLAEGECAVDEAVITGESLPISKAAGDAVIGGSVVTGGAAVVAVGDRTTSSIDQLTRTVWNLQSVDHGVQRRADALAATLLPFVVATAVVAGVASILLEATPVAAAMTVLLTIIVVSPWALGLATPCSVASSVRDALERGIVVFDESVFERLREIDVVVFDKTGTLTTGEMSVLEADAPAELLRAAGSVERRASHPAAAAIEAAFADGDGRSGESDDRGGSGETDGFADETTRTDGGVTDDADEPDEPTDRIREFRRHATGVEGTVDGRRVLVGHPDCFREQDWDLEGDLETRIAAARDDGRLPVVVGREGHAEGIVVVGDESRTEWDATVTALDESGIDVVVLTGDDDSAAARFRRHPGVEHVFAAVPPDGKTAAIRRLRAENRVAMVGDGTNDGPALAAADLGISLGSGTALAADAADLAIVDDDLAAVERAFALARAARERVVQNLGLALVYNAIVIPVALAGLLSPAVTTAALAASGLLIVANSSRTLLEA